MGGGQAWLGFGAVAALVVVAVSRSWRAAGLWIALAMAAQAGRRHGRTLGDAHQLHREIALDDLGGGNAEIVGHERFPLVL